MTGKRFISFLAALFVSGVCFAAGDAVDKNYYVYVAAESDDTVHLVKFGPDGGELVRTVSVGAFATETEGPHGIRVSPDGRYWYVSIAHGMPYGSVFKYDTSDNISVSDVQVGLFPATMDISATTGLMFVANFNLHGDMEPSTISVIDTVSMIEIAQIDQGFNRHQRVRSGPPASLRQGQIHVWQHFFDSVEDLTDPGRR